MKLLPGICSAGCLLLALSGCLRTPEEAKTADAVRLQMALYPQSRLQDLYKAFFQAEFGAEHIVPDTASAGRYLDAELMMPDSSDVLFEPVGADSSYFRVHLRAVQEGILRRQELFDLFIAGVHKVEIPQIDRWRARWPRIRKVIDGMGLDLPEYARDRARIDSVLATGAYAIHHSPAFRSAPSGWLVTPRLPLPVGAPAAKASPDPALSGTGRPVWQPPRDRICRFTPSRQVRFDICNPRPG